MFASSAVSWLYAHVAKPMFFRQDPEAVHDRAVGIGKVLGRSKSARRAVSGLFAYEHPALEQDVLGIHFKNPVGLAGGFDKNAELTDIMPSVGFGFTEVGSVTGEPCPGNPKPRLWRLPKSQGLVVWYGLKNDGAEVIAKRLSGKKFAHPIGTNVAKTNCKDTVNVDKGIADYVKALRAFADIGDYFTVNVSCPNAYGGEPFSSPERLDLLLSELDRIETSKPVLIKLGVDISTGELDRLVEVADRHRVHGFILSNLTKKRDLDSIDQVELKGLDRGGISGEPTREPSNALISHLYRTTGKRYVIIGLGGIMSAEDAYEKIQAGATLVQLITGMVFKGPQLIGQINKGLVSLLQKDGFNSVSEAVGGAHNMAKR